MMENIIHSDHTFNFIEMNLDMEKKKEETIKNHATTRIPEYEIKEATETEWANFLEDFGNIKLEEKFDMKTDVNDITDIVIEEIEEKVMRNLKQRWKVMKSHLSTSLGNFLMIFITDFYLLQKQK